MSKQTTRFLVGLFTIFGAALAVGAIIWVGATRYFEKGNMYVTYFEESVQGLQRDSSVKYLGVEVGRVQDIRVAPDNRLIAVVMKINMRDDLGKKMVAQLRVAGITGLVFVELTRRDPKAPDVSPKLTFPSEYPVIPSKPSELTKILDSVGVVVEKFSQVDARGLLDQVKATAAEVEIFFRGPRMDAILKNVEATLSNVKSITGQTDKLLASGRVEDVLVGTRDVLKSGQLVFEDVRGLNLKEIVGKVNALAGELRGASGKLQQTLDNADALLMRLKYRPSDALMGGPPKPRWNEK